MLNIDLHLHTNYSDGIQSPQDVVRRAKSCGLDVIAITDHDGIGGVKSAQEEGQRIGVRVISGVELSAEFSYAAFDSASEMHEMHILGYNMKLDSLALSDKMEDILRRRRDRNERLRSAFMEKGITISEDELKRHSPSGYVGKVSFARALAGKGFASDIREAFTSKKLLQAPEIKSIRKVKTAAGEAINMIHQAGGLAFLAHPFQLSYASLTDDPQLFRERLALILAELKILGLDGLECYYPTHDQEQTDFLLRLADLNGFLVSIGSDDHGPDVRKIKKIHSLQVEADLKRLEWIGKLK